MSISNLPDYGFIHRLEELSFVDAIWLYGSRARGDNFERADIDLAVVCPKAAPEDWSRVLEIVEDADTLLNIDCVRYDQLKPGDSFRKSIDREKQVLFSRASLGVVLNG